MLRANFGLKHVLRLLEMSYQTWRSLSGFNDESSAKAQTNLAIDMGRRR